MKKYKNTFTSTVGKVVKTMEATDALTEDEQIQETENEVYFLARLRDRIVMQDYSIIIEQDKKNQK